MTKFKGTAPALVTPFTDDLKVDFVALERLLDYVSSGHVDYFVVCGTTGESATLSEAEKSEVLDFVKKYNQGDRPLVYGIGGNSTRAVLDQIANTDFNSVDAILSVSPYYNKPTQEGLLSHYRTIADHSPVPLILYNVPGRTSSNLEADTTLVLAKHPNIIGIKEASGDMEQCMRIARDRPSDFLLISGDDLLTSSMISYGADGVISVLANAFPDEFTAMINAALDGNFKKSTQGLFEFLDINPLMYNESNPVGVKAALSILGICNDKVRLPLLEASETLKEELRQVIKSAEIGTR